MKKVLLLISFFFLTPILLVFSLILFSYTSYTSYIAISNNIFNSNFVQTVYATNIEQDPRVDTVKQFLAQYGSPLEPFAQEIVDTADYYNLDWKLVPAIAMQESQLCKRIPQDSYNCWGFGIYGGRVIRFTNYSDAIQTVTKTLATEYKEQRGLETPIQIMTRYTPLNTNDWAGKVTHFMALLSTP